MVAFYAHVCGRSLSNNASPPPPPAAVSTPQVMADGDIHVYGTLRGRALAGLSGKKSAKVGRRRQQIMPLAINTVQAVRIDTS